MTIHIKILNQEKVKADYEEQKMEERRAVEVKKNILNYKNFKKLDSYHFRFLVGG